MYRRGDYNSSSQAQVVDNTTRPNTPGRGPVPLARYMGQPAAMVYGYDSQEDSFQQYETAAQDWQANLRSPTLADPVPANIRRWPGRASQLGTQWDPKLGGNANLKSHGFWASWNTLRLSPAYVPMARQQQKRSLRTTTTRYRAFETLNVPAVYVPTSPASFRGGFGKP